MKKILLVIAFLLTTASAFSQQGSDTISSDGNLLMGITRIDSTITYCFTFQNQNVPEVAVGYIMGVTTPLKVVRLLCINNDRQKKQITYRSSLDDYLFLIENGISSINYQISDGVAPLKIDRLLLTKALMSSVSQIGIAANTEKLDKIIAEESSQPAFIETSSPKTNEPNDLSLAVSSAYQRSTSPISKKSSTPIRSAEPAISLQSKEVSDLSSLADEVKNLKVQLAKMNLAEKDNTINHSLGHYLYNAGTYYQTAIIVGLLGSIVGGIIAVVGTTTDYPLVMSVSGGVIALASGITSIVYYFQGCNALRDAGLSL